MSKINVRSPYYITYNQTNLTEVGLQLYIYTGTQTVDRTQQGALTGYYDLRSFAIEETVTFDISEIVKDFIETNFTGGVYSCKNVWVDYKATLFTPNGAEDANYTQCRAFDGYGYFEDGPNPANESGLLMSNRCILKPDDSVITIPVDTSLAVSVTFVENNEEVFSKLISGSSQSTNMIEYVSNLTNSVDNYEERVTQDGGTFESNVCLSQFEDTFSIFGFDTIYVDTIDEQIKVEVKNINECKYTPLKLTFVNKFGALQDLYFFKTSKEKLNVKEESFKRNIVTNGTYDISRHQKTLLTKNGQRSLSINSGYYPEENNEVFSQLLLSQECWIEYENKTLPITIKTSNINYKTHLNDKLIEYAMEIEFANEKINNVR